MRSKDSANWVSWTPNFGWKLPLEPKQPSNPSLFCCEYRDLYSTTLLSICYALIQTSSQTCPIHNCTCWHIKWKFTCANSASIRFITQQQTELFVLMHNDDIQCTSSCMIHWQIYNTANAAARQWQTVIHSTIHNIHHAMERDEETGDNRLLIMMVHIL